MQPLQERNFWFLSESEVTVFDINVPQIEDEEGYISEVDLEYLAELHDLHNDYPLAPKRFVVTKEIIFEYGKHLAEKLGVIFSKIEKIVPNFYDKKEYVLHIREFTAVYLFGNAMYQDTSHSRVHPVSVVGVVHRKKHAIESLSHFRV